MTEGGTTEPPVPGRLELSAPADPAILDLVHAMLEQLWQAHADIADRDRGRFEMAVVEILGNIVEHAYELDHAGAPGPAEELRRFDICVSATDDDLVARFGDNGLPMELDLENIAMPDPLSESGRGLALVSAAVDDLQYERIEGRNHWRLRCFRSRV
jgi:serine/threonine-protein kinase RsbW